MRRSEYIALAERLPNSAARRWHLLKKHPETLAINQFYGQLLRELPSLRRKC